VARRGKIVYYKSTGYDDLDNRVPLEKDAIFRVASQTKGITTVAVMLLYEEGLFTLKEPVSKFLPGFRNPVVLESFNNKDSSYTTRPAKREITIHDLLTHRSGYCYPGSGGEAVSAIYAKLGLTGGIPNRNTTLKEEMQKIAGAPLAHEPGEKYSYGLSTDILGYLVEVLSGQTLEEFFRTRICDPLGMEDTWFCLPEEKHDRLMNLYTDDPSGDGISKFTDGLVDFPKTKGIYFSGGGGLSSTALDFAIFQQMLLNGGEYNGVRLLGRKTIDMMRTNQIGEQGSGSLYIPGHPDKFGLGFEVISPPGSITVPMSENSFGWGGAFGSLYWMDPQEDLVVHLVLQKHGEYNILRWKFIACVYQALE